jgi:hydrogenase maturation factor
VTSTSFAHLTISQKYKLFSAIDYQMKLLGSHQRNIVVYNIYTLLSENCYSWAQVDGLPVCKI